jgi:DNA-binding HxlR family transcriptional regulator
MTKNFLKNPVKLSDTECSKSLLPVQDALYVLNGKWKLPIIIALIHGNKRFKELHKEIKGITAKMLSKELKELEINSLVKRTVYDTMPVTIEYELTEYGTTLDEVIIALRDWGLKHRQKIKERK